MYKQTYETSHLSKRSWPGDQHSTSPPSTRVQTWRGTILLLCNCVGEVCGPRLQSGLWHFPPPDPFKSTGYPWDRGQWTGSLTFVKKIIIKIKHHTYKHRDTSPWSKLDKIMDNFNNHAFQHNIIIIYIWGFMPLGWVPFQPKKPCQKKKRHIMCEPNSIIPRFTRNHGMMGHKNNAWAYCFAFMNIWLHKI